MTSQITSQRLFTQPFILTQIKENIKAPRHWPLCREFTGTGEFPTQMASNAENVSIWWRHHDILINVCLTAVEIFNVLSLTNVSFEILRKMAQREALVFWAKNIKKISARCVLLLLSITCFKFCFYFWDCKFVQHYICNQYIVNRIAL